MREFLYEAMDETGKEITGSVEAGSAREATAKLRSEGLFVTKLFGPEVTPEWSGISLKRPTEVPAGRFLAEGLPTTLDQRGVAVEGSLNLLGENGILYLVFDREKGREPAIKLPFSQLSHFQQRGLFRKRLVITANTGEEYVFRSSAAEASQLLEWATAAAREVTGGSR